MSIPELILELRPAANGSIVADVGLRAADGSDEPMSDMSIPVALDEDALLQVADDPEIL